MEQNTWANQCEKFVNMGDCFKDSAMFNRKPMQFLKHSSYTSVSTGI